MDLTAIASQLSDFKTVVNALADLTDFPKAFANFFGLGAGKGISSALKGISSAL